MIPRKLERHVDWHDTDVADPAAWTITLTQEDHAELDRALAHAKAVSLDLLDIGREQFLLDGLVAKIAAVEQELINGRGFMRISALDAQRYSDDDLTMLYWGIGMHLGDPWPQNHHGHVMGDVTDQGRQPGDPRSRGNELGQVALDYHTDGSDLVGLMCLRPAKSGGLSCVANVVAIYNDLLDERPDLAAALYDELPWDTRGEQPPGSRPFYLRPVFIDHDDRLFVRFIPQYIKASQRHADSPRLTPVQREALDRVSAMANDPRYNVYMDLRPGEMQFINNYHVLHGRTAYVDDVPAGLKRHLKRLWLSTRSLTSRPSGMGAKMQAHWARNRSVSKIAPPPRVPAE
jgi:Taurine catabolism dioxygenase TauD, TfdA family